MVTGDLSKLPDAQHFGLACLALTWAPDSIQVSIVKEQREVLYFKQWKNQEASGSFNFLKTVLQELDFKQQDFREVRLQIGGTSSTLLPAFLYQKENQEAVFHSIEDKKEGWACGQQHLTTAETHVLYHHPVDVHALLRSSFPRTQLEHEQAHLLHLNVNLAQSRNKKIVLLHQTHSGVLLSIAHGNAILFSNGFDAKQVNEQIYFSLNAIQTALNKDEFELFYLNANEELLSGLKRFIPELRPLSKALPFFEYLSKQEVDPTHSLHFAQHICVS